MPVERRGQVTDVGSEPTGNRRNSNSRREAAAFVRWHEPDDARVSSPDLCQITTLPAFSAKVYGTSVALTHSLTAPHFDQLLQQILVPASAIPETFTIAADQSTLLALSGSAPITGGAWSLPVAAGLPPPGTILGAGNVAILLGSGLQVQWTDVQPFIAQSASVLVGPGQIGVMLTFATQPFSETFQLWQEQGGARNSTIEFDYPA